MISIKAFVCSLVILALLVSGFVINYIVLKNKSQILIENMEALKASIERNDEKNIISSYEDTIISWKKHIKYMLMFSNHSNLDNISQSLIVIDKRIKDKNYPDALEEIEIVLSTLLSIPMNETLRAENIF
ncbi:MAG: DUF4363 family protein [Ruminococcaceae bacterium]|nr:DUF4363 family protein [Oscillospiraceae bacterium]